MDQPAGRLSQCILRFHIHASFVPCGHVQHVVEKLLSGVLTEGSGCAINLEDVVNKQPSEFGCKGLHCFHRKSCNGDESLT